MAEVASPDYKVILGFRISDQDPDSPEQFSARREVLSKNLVPSLRDALRNVQLRDDILPTRIELSDLSWLAYRVVCAPPGIKVVIQDMKFMEIPLQINHELQDNEALFCFD